jgi:hypothetical protein
VCTSVKLIGKRKLHNRVFFFDETRLLREGLRGRVFWLEPREIQSFESTEGNKSLPFPLL